MIPRRVPVIITPQGPAPGDGQAQGQSSEEQMCSVQPSPLCHDPLGPDPLSRLLSQY